MPNEFRRSDRRSRSILRRPAPTPEQIDCILAVLAGRLAKQSHGSIWGLIAIRRRGMMNSVPPPRVLEGEKMFRQIRTYVLLIGILCAAMVATLTGWSRAGADDPQPKPLKSGIVSFDDAKANQADWGEMRRYFTGETSGRKCAGRRGDCQAGQGRPSRPPAR